MRLNESDMTPETIGATIKRLIKESKIDGCCPVCEQEQSKRAMAKHVAMCTHAEAVYPIMEELIAHNEHSIKTIDDLIDTSELVTYHLKQIKENLSKTDTFVI